MNRSRWLISGTPGRVHATLRTSDLPTPATPPFRGRRTYVVARYPRRVRRWVSGLVTVGIVAVALAVWQQRQAPDSCLRTVELGGVIYTEATTTEQVLGGNELGIGTLRCGSYARPIMLNRTPGLDPDVALASPIAAYVLYLAPGVTPQDLPDKFGTVRLLRATFERRTSIGP